jgi:hypothetical protein
VNIVDAPVRDLPAFLANDLALLFMARRNFIIYGPPAVIEVKPSFFGIHNGHPMDSVLAAYRQGSGTT